MGILQKNVPEKKRNLTCLLCSQNSKEVNVARVGKKGRVVGREVQDEIGARSWLGTMVRTLGFTLSVQESCAQGKNTACLQF